MLKTCMRLNRIPVYITPIGSRAFMGSTVKTSTLFRSLGSKQSKSSFAPYSTGSGNSSSTLPVSQGPPVAKVDPSPALFKVGLIREVDYHPDADKLFVSRIDVGNDDVRTVISGLTMHFQPEGLKNKHVVLVTNLKPQKLRGITSEAMILAGEHTDMLESSESRTVDSEVGWDSIVEERLNTVELVEPPTGSTVGDQLHFEGFDGQPADMVKPKQWFHMQEHMIVNESRQVAFKVNDESGKIVGYSRLINEKGEPATLRTLTEGSVR
jgi:aminoacyl tRNA synthase complex-interacting multifunctional protein 1